MKRSCLFFLLVFSTSHSFSQIIESPTIRQIYNFAVGDSFNYNSPYGKYSETIITREDFLDSIVYTKRVVSIGNSNAIPQIYRSKILNLDKPYYYNNFQPGSIIYTKYSAIDNDTFYNAFTNGSCIYGNATYYEIYHWELGDVYSGFYGIGGDESTGGPQICASFTCLTFAQKANGKTFGNSSDCYYRGTLYADTGYSKDTVDAVPKLRITTVKVFPNPTSALFELQLSEMPAQETYFQLFDELGRPVKRKLLAELTSTIYRDQLANGLYFWQVEYEDRRLSRGKVILQ